MPYDRKHRLQDSMNGRIDKAMKSERDQRLSKQNKSSRHLNIDKLPYLERWPSFNEWESELQKLLSYPLQKYLIELRDYHGMNTRPQEAYNYIKRMWKNKHSPDIAARELKKKLGW